MDKEKIKNSITELFEWYNNKDNKTVDISFHIEKDNENKLLNITQVQGNMEHLFVLLTSGKEFHDLTINATCAILGMLATDERERVMNLLNSVDEEIYRAESKRNPLTTLTISSEIVQKIKS